MMLWIFLLHSRYNVSDIIHLKLRIKNYSLFVSYYEHKYRKKDVNIEYIFSRKKGYVHTFKFVKQLTLWKRELTRPMRQMTTNARFFVVSLTTWDNYNNI